MATQPVPDVSPPNYHSPPAQPPSMQPQSSSLTSPISPVLFYSDCILTFSFVLRFTSPIARIKDMEVEVDRLTGLCKRQISELRTIKRRARRLAEKDAERAAKAQRKKEVASQRKEKEAERLQQRRDRPVDAPFTGSLNSKNRPDLQEVAGALGLPETGTKEVLLRSINAYFEANPEVRDSSRFSGLFKRATRRQPCTDENGRPMASTSYIQPEPLATNVLNTLATNTVSWLTDNFLRYWLSYF